MKKWNGKWKGMKKCQAKLKKIEKIYVFLRRKIQGPL